MAEAILVVKIDSEGNVQAIKQANEEIAETGKASKESSTALGGLKKAAALVGGTLAALKTAQVAVDFVKLGANVQATEHRFVAFAGSQEKANEYLEAFNEATYHTVDRMGAMSGASKMLQMGLVDSSEEMATMAAVAVRLGDQTMDAGARIGDFSALLANQSIPRLDNFGISSGKVRARIDDLTSSIEGMTREEAFKIAVLEEGQKALDKLGDTSQSTSVRIAQLESAFKDAKTGMADFAAMIAAQAFAGGDTAEFTSRVSNLGETMKQTFVIVSYGVTWYKKFMQGGFDAAAATEAAREAVRNLGEEWTGVAPAGENVARALEQTAAQASDVGQQSDIAKTAFMEFEEAMIDGTESGWEYADAGRDIVQVLKDQREAAGDAAQKFADMAESLKGASEAEIARTAIRELGDLLDEDKITAAEYAQAVQETQLAFGLADEASINLANRLNSLVGALGEGRIGADEFDESLGRLIEVNTMENAQIEKFGQILSGTTTPAMSDFTGALDSNAESQAQAAGLTEEHRKKMRDLEQQTLNTTAQFRQFRDAIAAIPETKNIEIRVKEIREIVSDESRGAPIPEFAKQLGGPVMAGRPYLVGEVGPELFIPERSGQIIPNSQLPSNLGPGWENFLPFLPDAWQAAPAPAPTPGPAPLMPAPPGSGEGPRIVINNYFGAGSVRSDDDIYRINREQERILELKAAPLWECH